MKNLIAVIAVFSLLCFSSNTLGQTINKSADTVKTSTAKPSITQISKSDANATVTKTVDVNNTATANSKTNTKKAVTMLSPKVTAVDMTFEQAIEILRNSTTPPLKIVVLWGQIEKAGIERIRPVSMEGLSGVKLGTALKFVLDSASLTDAQLDYWVKDGIIIIGLKESKPDDKTTVLFNVCDITSAPSNPYGAMGGFNFGNQQGTGAFGQNNYLGGAGRYGNLGGYGSGRMSPQQFGGGYGGGYGGYGGGGGYGMGMRTGTSLGVGGGYGGYGGGYGGGGGMYGGGNGMGGIGMGGYGVMNDPQETLYRQQQLKTLIQTTIVPDSWNP